MAGCALTQIGGVSQHGFSNYIVDSFIVVVTGGVGKLAGAIWAGMGLGMMNKFLEALFRRGLGQSPGADLRRDSSSKRGRPASSPPKGGSPMHNQHRPTKSRRSHSWIVLAPRRVSCRLVYATRIIGIDKVNQLGRYLCFAIVALGIDLVWGYTGILSLCQAMFFCLGAYAMGMHLALHGPTDGANHDIPRCLFVVSSDVGGFALPWFWEPFRLALPDLVPRHGCFPVSPHSSSATSPSAAACEASISQSSRKPPRSPH